MLFFHKQCLPEMKIVFLRFGIQKQHFFHHPTKMPHTSKVAPLYGVYLISYHNIMDRNTRERKLNGRLEWVILATLLL